MIHLVFPDKVANFMPFSFEFLQPANYLKDHYNAAWHYQTAFLNEVSNGLSESDVLIWFIDCTGDENIEKLANCKARKFLRAVDPSKSDRILYKNQLALHEKVCFEGFAICYPNYDHIKYLESKDIRVFVWPHSLDFTKSKDVTQKKNAYICAGQQHKDYYPDRWKLTEILCSKFPNAGIFLPHPGFETDRLAHPYVGEKFLELLENFCIMPVGVGINDGLHMKFVEAAYSSVLPIGLVPSYMPEEIFDAVPFSRLDPKDYVVDEIAAEIERLFQDQNHLSHRTMIYRNFFKQNYQLQSVLDKIMKEISK
jgi:hypothetical protein